MIDNKKNNHFSVKKIHNFLIRWNGSMNIDDFPNQPQELSLVNQDSSIAP